ncbi:MAG: hypothetical protein CMM07_25700 [Rhodopirellula sp.]|nr:hypothetical protein [Rhodopirellula sp.]
MTYLMKGDGYRPDLLPKVRSPKIMATMDEMPCTTRVSSLYPGHRCSLTLRTEVGAHERGYGAGMATKTTDMGVAASCDNCHAIIDGVDQKRRTYIEEKCPTAFEVRLRKGLMETHAMLLIAGVIIIKDAKFV